MGDSAIPMDGLAPGNLAFPRRAPPASSANKSEARDVQPVEPTDAEWVRRVARRDGSSGQALEVLFLRHAEPLHRFMARTLRNEEEAEDLVHDAFLRVVEKAGTYRGEGSFRTWLFALALNLVRSRKRREAIAEGVYDALAVEHARRKPDGDPARQAQERETWARVEAAIAGLNPAERETFLLFWFGKLRYTEISRLQEISVAAAKVRVHRALARLSESLGAE
jgi:RNA polymerase sigma-70 factor (ECF subfamily)